MTVYREEIVPAETATVQRQRAGLQAAREEAPGRGRLRRGTESSPHRPDTGTPATPPPVARAAE